MSYELRLIGPPVLLLNGKGLRPPRRKALALLAYLAIQRRPTSRDRLAALLWPDAPPAAGRTSLRRLIADLNQLLGENWRQLDEANANLTISSSFQLSLDVDHLRQFARDPSVNHQIDPDCCERWCTGSFMEGFEMPGLDVWEEWLYSEGQVLRSLQREAAKKATAESWRSGDHHRALRWSTLWCTIDNLDEVAFRAHLEALTKCGQAEAMPAAVQAFRERLSSELGIDILPDTQRLFEDLRTPICSTAPASEHLERSSTVQYVPVDDGLYIATRVLGEGGPWLAFISGFVSHLDYCLKLPALWDFFQQLARSRRVLLFDKRGTGLSDRCSPPRPEQIAGDLLRIFDFYGITNAALMGTCEGGTAALNLARIAPEKITHLILDGSSACWISKPTYPHGVPKRAYQKWVSKMEAHWGDALFIEEFAPSARNDPSLVYWWSSMLRSAASPGAIKSIFDGAELLDCVDWLSEISTPTLVAHRIGDKIVRVENGRYLARHIRDSKYVELPGQDHFFWTERSELLLAAVNDFLEPNLKPLGGSADASPVASMGCE